MTADDFRRLTYEALEDAVAANVRYREMFFSPGFALGDRRALTTVWDGIRAGLADAHHDLDVRCRMILDVDKPSGPGPAAELVEFAGRPGPRPAHRRGRRLHRARRRPPGLRTGVRACRASSGCTAPSTPGEDGPADNIAAAVDDLGVERVDHGFRLLDDPELTARVADARIPLTVCPISNVVIANVIDDVARPPVRPPSARPACSSR